MLIVASNNLLGLVFYIPFLLLTGEPFRALSGVELTIVVLVSLVVNTFSYVIFSAGLQSVKTLDASLITLIEPLMNPILVILVLREIPASMDILILFIILSSLVLDLVHSHTVLIQRR
jgi:drug/metabolite transporter (DMT)-like permease